MAMCAHKTQILSYVRIFLICTKTAMGINHGRASFVKVGTSSSLWSLTRTQMVVLLQTLS
jgi:hypothetical protein